MLLKYNNRMNHNNWISRFTGDSYIVMVLINVAVTPHKEQDFYVTHSPALSH